MDNCKTQEVQINRVLKTMVLFFILTGVSWQAVTFSEADLQKLKSSLKCPKCDLTGANLEGAVLHRADLTEANLFHANLAGATLRSAVLTKSMTMLTNLTGADLSGAI